MCSQLLLKERRMNKKICYVATIPLTIRSFFIPQLKYLSDNGFDVTVVCSDDGKIAGELGEKVHFHGIIIPRGLSLYGSLNAIKELKQYFKEQQFDLIQYSTPNAALYAAIAAKSVGCKVRNYHLMGYRYLGAKGVNRLILKSIEKITCRLSTSIECVSRSNLELGVKEKVFRRDKATVVWNGSSGGVDLERFDYKKRTEWRAELRKQLGYKDKDFIFGFVGRITRDKGINELLEAFFKLNDDSKLFIIGSNENDGTFDSELWNKALSNPNVYVHNPSDEIEKYYAMIDVLVLPSYREGFGNVIIEAAAMGTPAIVSDIPGPKDAILVNKTGLSVKLKSVNDLVHAMQRIRCECIDEMGSEAENFIKENYDSMVLCEKIRNRKISLLKNMFCNKTWKKSEV